VKLPGLCLGEGDCLRAGDLGLPNELELPVTASLLGIARSPKGTKYNSCVQN